MWCQGSNPMDHLQGKHPTSCTIVWPLLKFQWLFYFSLCWNWTGRWSWMPLLLLFIFKPDSRLYISEQSCFIKGQMLARCQSMSSISLLWRQEVECSCNPYIRESRWQKHIRARGPFRPLCEAPLGPAESHGSPGMGQCHWGKAVWEIAHWLSQQSVELVFRLHWGFSLRRWGTISQIEKVNYAWLSVSSVCHSR